MNSPRSTFSGSSNSANENEQHTPKASRMCRPKFLEPGSPQMFEMNEVDEIGWGDSPEPLKFDLIAVPPKKAAPCETPVSHKKKRTVRPSKRQSLAFTAEQDLAILKNIARTILGDKFDGLNKNQQLFSTTPTPIVPSKETASNEDESFIVNSDSSDTHSVPLSAELNSEQLLINSNSSALQSALPPAEPTTEKDLESLFQEDDDLWLSQVDLGDSCRTPRSGKGGLVKSRSENELEGPSPNRSGSLRRYNSLQPSFEASSSTSVNHNVDPPPPLKKQKSFHDQPEQTQCTAEEIEQKRLQAIYRREFRQIERRKLEAQKRLNAKFSFQTKR